ncbi:putative lysine-specific demethylase JMJ16 isoform X2 [Impatiens glandulifera]|uniref:putative lysine-specific demethylase JMJ16 isoform X2 n=1 Tax=Impatiens glandulifera TaxID=253017 RepID=UPI001FB0994F|nr:putative lysine-specific demethylase JMJ16 isoform X2 [Impatiens glandulifera]
MGTKILRHFIKEEEMDIPLIPPGFESFAPQILKGGVEDNNETSNNSCSISTRLETANDTANIKRTRKQRIKINYNNDPGHGPDLDKVTARWRPEDGRRPVLEDAPVFYPTEEEFIDTLNYIASIRPTAEKYGICRIVPPPSWKPPCSSLKEKSFWEKSTFSTRVQKVNKLQNRESMKMILKFNSKKSRKKRRCAQVNTTGNCDDIGVCGMDSFGFQPGPEFTLDTFHKYADDFKTQYFRRNISPEEIEGEYWRIVERPTEEIEVLYGADVDTGNFRSGFPKCGNEDGLDYEEKYVKSGWNLNNFPKLQGSVLNYESSDISGVVVPWLYIGMCFSSFCWHVEDHYLYSLNYMHFGAPKLWYGVPGDGALKLEAAMKKHLPNLFAEQPDLLNKLVTQLSPSILRSEGVPIYRCVQNSGEFVLTFPRAYHSGLNCGFNCAEAVNVAPIDWFPHGQTAIELYREQGRKTSLSHDKLLLGTAREAVKAHWELSLLRRNTSYNLKWKSVCGKDGILTKALKDRVEVESVRRKFCCGSAKAVKMESDFDTTSEKECVICFFDLHLSAARCSCSPDKYTCLSHVNQLCSCSYSEKVFIFRYDIDEMSILVDALEGKLSAVYKWANQDLGLALSSSFASRSVNFSQNIEKGSANEIGVTLISRGGGSNNKETLVIQKGPRIAKVIRRRKSHIEPIEYGVVQTGKRWCDSKAIFPKGFRSRVRYISILEPTTECYYVSEIVDAGRRDFPLFMVSVEECPSEVFIHVSARKCWEMVRERLNQEITRQHKIGKRRTDLPPLQITGILDGLEMFGFSSPPIMQVIETMDRNHICTEYWKSGQSSHIQGDAMLNELLKKANQEELKALLHILSSSGESKEDDGLLTKLLHEEIRKRPKNIT